MIPVTALTSTALKAALTAKPLSSKANSGKIRVLIADDHTIVREGLSALIAAADDLEVIGQAKNGRAAVQTAKELQPDVVVMDLSMPMLNGSEATRQIIKACPKTKVLILSSYDDGARVQELMKEGASGYIVKQTAATELLDAIREAHRGNSYFSPSVSARLMESQQESYTSGSSLKPKTNQLTTRETEVLQLLAEGYANKHMADELGISIKTIEKHRQQVMNKLNIHEVASLTRYAAEHGIIPTGDELRKLKSFTV